MIKIAYTLFSVCTLVCSSLTGQTDLSIDKEGNKLLFILLEIKMDSAKNVTLNLLEQKTIQGKRKKVNHLPYTIGNTLKIKLCKGDSVITSEVFEHPLYKHIEYADETGKPVGKNIQLDKSEFFVRIPFAENADNVAIVEAIHGVPEKRIAIIPLVK